MKVKTNVRAGDSDQNARGPGEGGLIDPTSNDMG